MSRYVLYFHVIYMHIQTNMNEYISSYLHVSECISKKDMIIIIHQIHAHMK